MPDTDLLSLVGLSLGGLSLFRFFPLFRADVTLFEVLGALRGALLVALRETLFLDELLVELLVLLLMGVVTDLWASSFSNVSTFLSAFRKRVSHVCTFSFIVPTSFSDAESFDSQV